MSYKTASAFVCLFGYINFFGTKFRGTCQRWNVPNTSHGCG